MSIDRRVTAVHLNLAHASAQLARLDPEAELIEDEGLILCAEAHEHPAIANAAFRTDDHADPVPLVERAAEFFSERRRGFSFWVRGNRPEDEDLVAAATAAGLNQVYEMPQMTCAGKVEEPALNGGALERVRTDRHARDYWAVTAEAYKSLEFPPELFSAFTEYAGLWAENVRAFLAYADGEPSAAAMTIVTDGIAGIYWVGTLEWARGKGLARAVTAAATNAGFDLGAEIASLQASHMGAPLYRDMGYETLFPYRLLMAPPPKSP